MAHKRTSLGVIFLTLFIDLIGFSILFPLFAEIMAYFGQRGEGLVGTIDGWITAVYPAATIEQRAALFGGVLMGLYALLQFLCAPIWGALSDRIGRRPVLLLTILGNTLGYALWVVADSFLLLLVSRAICGLMAGNISVATAAVADVTDERSRAKGMGFVGMAFGLGFILGPAFGGLGYEYLPRWEGGAEPGFGLNPFSTAALIACGLSALNLLWVVTRFAETKPVGDRSARPFASPLAPFTAALGTQVRTVVVANLVFTLLFAGLEATLVFLAWDRLAYGPAAMAGVFVVLGFTSAAVQGGLVRRMAPKYGERRLAMIGFGVMIPAFLALGAVAWLPAGWLMYLGIVLLALGIGLVMPTLSALASLAVGPEQQGLALGGFRSAGALARAIGPFIGAGTYFALGPAAPYLTGAVLLLIPMALIARLPAAASAAKEA